ncbi:hypothetical protein [uncultured Thiodictyon sp.]|uniref:hypothetical protein n=1 Tax=uncultured Thiodictyon sp. TaxID=1846217 RepID=UPI0025E50817|nr:hypothetical protein [uncultured Thiodictyon sp.]
MNEPIADLFARQAPPSALEQAAAPRLVWYLPSNQLNLTFMLAAGLVTGPAGFGGKYYADVLSVYPGWIPVFAERIPAAVLDLAVSEENHLRRVVAALDLSRLQGPVHALMPGGDLVPVAFPAGLTGAESMLFVPAPLPATWIECIHFASKEERTAIEAQAEDYANVSLMAYKRRVSPKLFAARPAGALPPAGELLPDRDRPTHGVAAVGGALGLLFALGNTGDALGEAGRFMADPGCDPLDEPAAPAVARDPLLTALRRWACLAGPAEGQDLQGRLLLEALQALVDAKGRSQGDPGAGAMRVDLHQTVLDYLASQGQRLTDDKLQTALGRLAGDLRGVLGLGGDTVSELLNRHTRPFSRGLLLFFLRQECQDLLDLRQPLLTELDYVVAATLFGARSGWMGLPPEVRGQPGLREAVAHRMAAVAQRIAESGLDLGPVPERIRPLRELFGANGADWTKSPPSAALALARALGWDQVLRTRIRLGKGVYEFRVDGRGAELLLDGDVKVINEIDREAFLAQLAEAQIPAKLAAQVRASLAPRG